MGSRTQKLISLSVLRLKEIRGIVAYSLEESDQVMDMLKLIEVVSPNLLELEFDSISEFLVSQPAPMDIISAFVDNFSQHSDFPSEAGEGRSRPSEVKICSGAERKFPRELLHPFKQGFERHNFMFGNVSKHGKQIKEK